MKEIFALLALVLVVGIGGFLYRNALERPYQGQSAPQRACSPEIRMCPDGTSIGRSGPQCSFGTCPFPNQEIGGLTFIVPTGFTQAPDDSVADPTIAAVYVASQLSPAAGGRIEIRRFVVAEGEGANEVAQRTAQPLEGESPTSMLEFTPIIIGTSTFETIELGTGEAARSAYYLLSEREVWRFDAIERPREALAEPAPARPVRDALTRLLGSLSTAVN